MVSIAPISTVLSAGMAIHKTTHAIILLAGKVREKQTLCTLHPIGEFCFDDAE